MLTLENVRKKVEDLAKKGGTVHMTVSMTNPKVMLAGEPAVIKGVYPHIFRIEEKSEGVPRCHTVKYTEVVTGQVTIAELSEV